MNMKKYLRKLLPLAIGGMILAGSMGTAFASSTLNAISSADFPSFKEFISADAENLSNSDFSKLEKLYKEIVELEKNEKFDQADKKWNEFYKILDKYYDIDELDKDFGVEAIDEINLPTFKEFLKEFGDITLSSEDEKAAEKIYNLILKLEKDGDYGEIDSKWDNLYKILSKYCGDCAKDDVDCANYNLPTFKKFISDFSYEKISAEDMKNAEKIYNEIVNLENDKKFDQANTKWNDLYDILDKYLEGSFKLETIDE